VGEGDRAVWLCALGVLPDAYAAADFAIVGGTLEAYGGHNPVEPAALGVPVILGPSLANCRAAAEALLAAGGARAVASAAELAVALVEWTREGAAREAAGRAARAGARSLAGAAARTLDWLGACGMWEP
jgi:3-deoxy-D-manno-octulosonic-acid transferase